MALGDPRITPQMKEQAAGLANMVSEPEDVNRRFTREELIAIVWEEYLYWHDCELDPAPSVYALGPLANIVARIAIGKEV